MRLVLYTGKGGVGKTTTAAATAIRAAEIGRRTLIASADAAHSLGDVLECRLGPEPSAIAACPGLDAVEIDARAEATRHWGRVREYLVALFTHQGIEEVVADELALLPGAEEITTLLAVEEHAASKGYDMVVVDCAPTDATLRLVTLPDVAHRALRILLPLARAVSGVALPVAQAFVSLPLPGADVFRDAENLLYHNLRDLQCRLKGPDTSVRMVVTPERMVIDEARRAYTEMSLFEISVDAVVMNRLLPEDAGREAFFRERYALEAERRREVEVLFSPLPVLAAPLRDDEVTGVERLAAHGRELFATLDPDSVLCRSARVSYDRDGDAVVATIPLPGADVEHLDVVKVEDELTITVGLRRRMIVLPRSVARLEVASAALRNGALQVRFAPQGGPAANEVAAQREGRG